MDERELKQQLALQRRSLSLSGSIDFSGKSVFNLSPIGEQPKLQTLNLSNTLIESLESLPLQPNLHELIADDTNLNTFSGFTRLNKVQKLSLVNTPLSEKENFRISCLVTIGPKLCTINDEPITPRERKIASQYPIIAKYLIEAGWPIVIPCPSNEELLKASKKYRVRIKPTSSEYSLEEQTETYFRPPPTFSSLSCLKDDVKSGLFSDDLNDFDLAEVIAKKLQSIGINVTKGESCQEEILQVVKSLTKIVECLRPYDMEIMKESQ